MSWSLPGEPALDVDDIQGHVLIGFGGAPQAIGAFTATDPAAVARVLAAWARDEMITSTRALLPRKGLRAKPLVAALGPWVAAAVSVRLLREIGAPATFSDPWLIAPGGMRDVSSALNDPEVPWVVGGPDALVDVLLVAAAPDTEAAVALVASFGRDAAGAIASGSFIEPLAALPGGAEHFGFADGLSQPAVLGTVDGDVFEPRGRDGGGAVPYAAPGQELIWPGHFVFGYPNRDHDNPRAPGRQANAGDPATSTFARNGSLLTYRRMCQDVAAFRRFCAAFAPTGVDPQVLQARIVGRWPSGLPIAEPAADPPPDRSCSVYNDFTFLGDRMQHGCPLSAHIRKVNPRLGGSDLANVVPRLLRRGMPFGPKYVEGEQVGPTGGRGLAFLSYQSSIRHQFGAIITDWVNNSTAPNNGGGQDFLIGQIPDPVSAQRIFVVPPKISDAHQSWVTPTGGAFMFAPSISALRELDSFG